MDKPCLQNHLYFKTTKLWPFLKVNGLPVCYDNYGLMKQTEKENEKEQGLFARFGELSIQYYLYLFFRTSFP